MIITNISDIPTIATRKGTEVKDISLEQLGSKTDNRNNNVFVSYSLKIGDVFEFPDTVNDIMLKARQISNEGDRYEYLILGYKNGNPAWLSLANLHRWDHMARPVHPVATELFNCNDDAERILKCLGRKITAEEDITYKQAVFENNIRTNKTTERTVAKLVFL